MRRYGAEFESLLLSQPGGLRNIAVVVRSAIRERMPLPKGLNESALPLSIVATRMSAILPVVMSLIALSVVLCHILIYGAAREAHEGAAAHICQFLMAGQMPVLAYFAIKWLPRAPKQSLWALAAQACAAVASRMKSLLPPAIHKFRNRKLSDRCGLPILVSRIARKDSVICRFLIGRPMPARPSRNWFNA